jgi:hypothetical protein
MSTCMRNDLIFGHDGNARVATSVTMAGMLAVLIGGSFMAIGPRLAQDPPLARNAAGGAPAPVRVIDAGPQVNAPCEQQLWPNIDRHCLVRADARPNTDATQPAAQDNDKLSPLTAAAVGHPSPPQDDATSAGGVQEDTALLRQTAPINVTGPPDAAVDDTDEAPPPRSVEPRKRTHRHYGFPFRLHFGVFRF